MDIYVGNLFYEATEEEIEKLFSSYGTVNSVRIIKDKASGKSKGFGFVVMENDDEVEEAIEALNKSEFHERNIIVRKSKTKEGGGGKSSFGNKKGGFRSGNRSGGNRRFNNDRKSHGGNRDRY